MPTTDTTEQPPTAEQPKHQLPQLTTYELLNYRRELERAITFYEKRHSTAPALAVLRTKLSDVQDEQESRKRVTDL